MVCPGVRPRLRTGRALARLVCIAGILALAAGRAEATDLPRAMGMYPAQGPALAMVDSKVEVLVRGPIAEVVVTQRFQNRADHATEATYIFPLPLDAAVTAMSIQVGARTIRGSIEKREEAQRRYEDAIRKGVGAGVLDQERPDVFTQTVAAIPARGTVEVTLRYDTVASYQAGTWELVLPMVVAPRYVPGAATSRPTTGAGRAPDTNRAPDASRVTPPGGPGAGGATQVAIAFADKVLDPVSPTHELRAAGAGYGFTDPKTDHDAVIRWRAAVPAAGWVEQGPDGGYAAVVVEAGPLPAKRGAVRCVLAIDRSAATVGDADAIARPFVRALLGELTATDRVAIAGESGFRAPADVQRAVDQGWQAASGAFDLTRVLRALRPEGAPIALVSSGLVADDAAAIAAARQLGVPIHVIGIGPAPARGLLAQLAVASGGTLRFLVPGDDLGAAAKAAVADVAVAPPPLAVTWGTLAASDVVPGTLPRLGAGQAILVLARVARAQPANARARGELFAIEAQPAGKAVAGATSAMGPLARRWARNRLDELIGRAAPAQIAAHALRYGLVSPHTSLVAIGEEVIVQGGVKRSVAVPVSVPAGMRWQAVKKETTVDTVTIKDAPVKETPVKATPVKESSMPVLDRIAKREEGKHDEKKPDKQREKNQRDEDDDEDNAEAKPKVKKPKQAHAGDRGGEQAERDDDGDAAPRPAPPAEPSATGSSEDAESDGAEESMLAISERRTLAGTTISAFGARRSLRITAALGGGLAFAGGGSPLLALSTRIELGGRTLLGLGGSLWLAETDGALDVQGQVMATVARLDLARWLELGGGAGLQLGNGTGPAAAASLRFHLPPNPRAAVYLRYDAALLFRDGERAGQHAVTLGIEVGF